MHNSLSETWGDAHTDRLPSTVEQFHDSLVNYSDNIALICTHQDAGLYGISTRDGSFKDAQSAPYLRWTFQDLKLGVSRLEGSLKSLGVKTGTPIITLLPNCAEFVLTWWAAMEIGAFVAPLDPRRLSNASETKNNLETIMKVADDKPPIIVAFDAESLDFPGISSIPRQAAIVVSTTRETEGRALFEDLMMTSQDAEIDLTKRVEHEVTPPGRSCILFTSGSTSLPKGVIRRPNLQASFARDVFRTPGYETLPGDLWCCVTPNNHCVGINSLISPMLVGAGVLYPGEAFSAEATAQALLQERCTHMIMVPTNVSLIAEYLAEDTGDMRTSLKAVALAGSPPTIQTVETCLQALGTRGVCVRYGSTEGLACDSEIVSNMQGIVGENGLLTVGRPVARDGVKICQPHGTDRLGVPLPRGMTGEIHYSAGAWRNHTMYIGREDTDDTCYTDYAGKRWLITGDEGMMDSQGRLYVVGRLKDTIIRGGENISPVAIEVRLANNPKLASKSIQIVGQPDPISGEVPIGVIASGPDFSETAAEIYRCIRADMGLMWAPHEVIHLAQLGLEDWPRTSMGKVNRNTLRKLVHKRYEDSLEASGGNGGQSGAMTGDGHIRQQILRAWASALALDEEQLPLDISISKFADSLSVAQVRGHLRRTVPGLGNISVRDVSGNNTLSEQIDLVVQAWRREGHNSPEESDHEGPPTADEMLHTIGQPDLFTPTKTLVMEVIEQQGFRWDDVASVFPAQNLVDELSRNGMLDTLRFQYAFTTKTEGSLEVS
ncbi:unnamed protein product [Penicillium olsonii]|nr:unnamed protein product [Penicillium olsonii]